IYVDGTRAGHVDYEPEGETFALNHTEVHPEFRHHGAGHALVVGALEQIRDLGGEVLPYCPFIPKVILENPEFITLVPHQARPQFGLE
ncbi:MAG: GNAT family N-acetyltransferase, partial [Aeromicrobium sp.]